MSWHHLEEERKHALTAWICSLQPEIQFPTDGRLSALVPFKKRLLTPNIEAVFLSGFRDRRGPGEGSSHQILPGSPFGPALGALAGLHWRDSCLPPASPGVPIRAPLWEKPGWGAPKAVLGSKDKAKSERWCVCFSQARNLQITPTGKVTAPDTLPAPDSAPWAAERSAKKAGEDEG